VRDIAWTECRLSAPSETVGVLQCVKDMDKVRSVTAVRPLRHASSTGVLQYVTTVGVIRRAITVDVMWRIAASRDGRCVTVRSKNGKHNEEFNDSAMMVDIMWCIAVCKNDRLP
jgi:hypothetical protein